MEINKNSVGILTCGGEFLYVRKISTCPCLGEMYESEEIKQKSLFYKNTKKLSIMVASLLITFVLSSYIVIYNNPVSAVTININPSIKLELNRWNNIIKITALNKDGEHILNNLNLKNKSLETVVTLILKESEKENYINDNYRSSNKIISLDFQGDVSKLDLTNIENTLKNLKTNYNIKTPKYNKTNYKENIKLEEDKIINTEENLHSEPKNAIDKSNLDKDKNILKIENSISNEKNIKSSNKDNIDNVKNNNNQNKANSKNNDNNDKQNKNNTNNNKENKNLNKANSNNNTTNNNTNSKDVINSKTNNKENTNNNKEAYIDNSKNNDKNSPKSEKVTNYNKGKK